MFKIWILKVEIGVITIYKSHFVQNVYTKGGLVSLSSYLDVVVRIQAWNRRKSGGMKNHRE